MSEETKTLLEEFQKDFPEFEDSELDTSLEEIFKEFLKEFTDKETWDRRRAELGEDRGGP